MPGTLLLQLVFHMPRYDDDDIDDDNDDDGDGDGDNDNDRYDDLDHFFCNQHDDLDDQYDCFDDTLYSGRG